MSIYTRCTMWCLFLLWRRKLCFMVRLLHFVASTECALWKTRTHQISLSISWSLKSDWKSLSCFNFHFTFTSNIGFNIDEFSIWSAKKPPFLKQIAKKIEKTLLKATRKINKMLIEDLLSLRYVHGLILFFLSFFDISGIHRIRITYTLETVLRFCQLDPIKLDDKQIECDTHVRWKINLSIVYHFTSFFSSI